MISEDHRALPIARVRLIEADAFPKIGSVQNCDDAILVIEKEFSDLDREMFGILNMNTKGEVINMSIVSVGTLSAALVHPREVFKSSILSNASTILCFHNHPSGNVTPSETDIEMTERLREAGDLLGIPLVDHIIIAPGSQGSFSFLEHGLIKREGDTYQALVAEEKETFQRAYI